MQDNLLGKEKCYGRDDRVLFKQLVLFFLAIAISLYVVFSAWNDLNHPNSFHQYRSGKALIAGIIGLLFFGFAALSSIVSLLTKAPLLTLSPRGLELKTAFRTIRANWSEISPFSFRTKSVLSANILAHPNKKIVIPVQLLVDKKELCAQLNKHIAAAQGLEVSAIVEKVEVEFSKVDADYKKTKEILWLHMRIKLAVLVLTGLLTFIGLKLLDVIDPDLFRAYAVNTIYLMLLVPPFIAVLITDRVVHRIYPLPPKAR